MQAVSSTGPCIVSVVTTADMPTHLPAGIVSPIVCEYTSTSLKYGTDFCVCNLIVRPSYCASASFEFHTYDGTISCGCASCALNSSAVRPTPCAFASARP